MRETKKYLLTILIFIAGLVLVFPALTDSGKVGGAYLSASQQFPIADNREFKLPSIKKHEEKPELTARSAIVKDVNSGLLMFEKNPDQSLPIASLTKLLTALVVREELAEDDVLLVEKQDLEVVPFRAELKVGVKYKVNDLLGAMLVGSANDASLVLARSAGGGSVDRFVEMMNKHARLIHMNSSSFSNPVGFDDPAHYSTIRDLTFLVEKFMSDPLFSELVSQKKYSFSSADGQHYHEIDNTNQLLDFDPRVAGVKTGYTDKAKGNLIVFIEDPEHPFLVFVLGSDDREGDARALINWAEESFEWK